MVEVPPPVSLQPPGAGLPRIELVMARLGLRLMGLTLSRRATSRWFGSEANQILALARSLSPIDLQRPILIRRLTGLEDSSRCWSVAMVVEHLVMVDTGILSVIECLAAGRTFPRAVFTADFKPPPSADATVIDRFESIAAQYLQRTESLAGWDSPVTHSHPWFADLRVPQWHRLAAFHHRIHRKQLERIIRGLQRT